MPMNSAYQATVPGSDARPQVKSKPQANPLGYVEDFDKPRTKQMVPYPSPCHETMWGWPVP
jgi:hypothetical protein